MDFYLYILKCNDSSYYIGHTDDLSQRVTEHQLGGFCEYTKWRRPVNVVYSECFATRNEAFHAERKIKKWTRVKKEALINKDWEELKKLSRKKFK